MKSSIKSLLIASVGLTALSLNAQIYLDTFETDTSGTFSGPPSYAATEGVGGSGALLFTNTSAGSAAAFSINIPVSLSGDTDVDITFDAKVDESVGGVFHMFVLPSTGGQQNFFNLEASINSADFSEVSKVATIPAAATDFTIRFEAITGAFDGSVASFFVDNLSVVDPNAVSVIPEPSVAGALFGLVAIGFVSIRRRR